MKRDELMTISIHDVEQFFRRYAKAFKDGLEGALNPRSLRSLYSTQYIAAGPKGVMAGDNDESFSAHMSKGYEQYRQLGTKAMTVTAIDVHTIDESHCIAHVDWISEFEKDGRRVDVAFKNTYFLELNDGELKVFGWVAGDEIQLLKDNGLM
jgi:hypothetical protein